MSALRIQRKLVVGAHRSKTVLQNRPMLDGPSKRNDYDEAPDGLMRHAP